MLVGSTQSKFIKDKQLCTEESLLSQIFSIDIIHCTIAVVVTAPIMQYRSAHSSLFIRVILLGWEGNYVFLLEN
jgi:hypothetical protein